MNIVKSINLILYLSISSLFQPIYTLNQGITHQAGRCVGDSVATFCLAKILSLKYNIPFYTYPFNHDDLFVLDENEKKLNPSIILTYDLPNDVPFSKLIRVCSEQDIINNLNENNALFWTDLRTHINAVEPSWMQSVKADLELKNVSELESLVNALPDNVIKVAVHIRKGNGGGEFYDGEQTSLQEFDFNKSQVSYLTDFYSYPFEWDTYNRPQDPEISNREKHQYENLSPDKHYTIQLMKLYNKNPEHLLEINFDRLQASYSSSSEEVQDKAIARPASSFSVDRVYDWQTKFPPDQFYIDQILKLYNDLKQAPLFVQIFTDDRNPKELLERIRNALNNTNIIVFYYDNRGDSHSNRIAQDLHSMSRFDVLIRGQSYFSRMVELIGNYKVVIYPLRSSWQNNKLIMHPIVIKENP